MLNESTVHTTLHEVESMQKRRPDKESISNHIIMQHGLNSISMLNNIDGMIEDSQIYDMNQ